MIKIIADNKIPFLEGVLEPYAEVKYLAGAKTGSNEIKDADALITRTRTKCNRSTLEGSRVKMIATATIGYDHIDTGYCKKQKIEWANAPGCNSGSVKQYIAATLAFISDRLDMKLENKTLGVVGVGNVGGKVADFARCIGMKVLLNDPPRAEKEGQEGFVELEELVKKSDVITFHVPLQREGAYKTFHLGNKELFSKCKKDVIIINSSRGEVVDNADLLEVLNRGAVAGAILDVWENEPDMNPELLKQTMIATPHIAGYSLDGKANGTAMSVQAICRYFDLPLKNWYPASIPPPENPIIEIDTKGLAFEEVWKKAVLHTYPISEDDKRFRNDPVDFERLRGSYPVRREFCAFKVLLKNGSEEIKKALNKIGFDAVELI